MICLGVCSQKGGVGKTTISLNLAYAFAKRGWKTVLVDVDPQGSIGLSLSERVSNSPGLAQIMTGETGIDSALIQTRLPELKLLPAGTHAPRIFSRRHQDIEEGAALYALVQQEEISKNDLLLIDTPSGLSGPTLGAIRVCQHVVVPVQAEPLAVRSLPRLIETLEDVNSGGIDVSVAGVLLSMVDTTSQEAADLEQELVQLLPQEVVMPAVIPRARAFWQASARGVPLGLLRTPPPPEAALFDQCAAELEVRIGLVEDEEESDEEVVSLVD